MPIEGSGLEIGIYYCKVPSVEDLRKAHSTVYLRRPQDDPALDELRTKRAKGRLEDSTT